MSELNIVDILILVVFFISMMIGFARGLISEVVSLVALIAAIFCAAMFSNNLASYFTSRQTVQDVVAQTSSVIGTSTAQPMSYLALGVSFVIIFLGVLTIGSIVKYILNMPFQFGLLGLGNRLFGGGFGLIRGFFINLVAIMLFQMTPLATESWWVNSKFVRAYQPAVGWLANLVSPTLSDIRSKFDSTLQDVNSSVNGLMGN